MLTCECNLFVERDPGSGGYYLCCSRSKGAEITFLKQAKDADIMFLKEAYDAAHKGRDIAMEELYAGWMRNYMSLGLLKFCAVYVCWKGQCMGIMLCDCLAFMIVMIVSECTSCKRDPIPSMCLQSGNSSRIWVQTFSLPLYYHFTDIFFIFRSRSTHCRLLKNRSRS